MKKKLLAILLTVCMVLSMAPAALAADSVFTDVNAGDWFVEEVKYVYDNGLMYGVGDNTFDPSGTVTRAMVWTTLARLDGVNTAGSDPWWLAGQKWAMENQISDGTMATENITREQLVTMIWRYAKYIDMDVSEGEDTNILSYTDAFDVNEWAIPAMQWACAVGIINGIDGALQPQGDASRAMLAAILYRFVEEVMPSEEEPEPSTPVVPSYPSIPVHFHSWTAGAPVAPTCTEQGYTPYTCYCGSSKNDDFVSAKDHAWGDWISNDDGTHTRTCGNDSSHTGSGNCEWIYVSISDDTHQQKCEKCGYVAVESITCSYDATTGKCDCGKSITVVAAIGNVGYASLQDAVNAVDSDDDIIVLLADITIADTDDEDTFSEAVVYSGTNKLTIDGQDLYSITMAGPTAYCNGNYWKSAAITAENSPLVTLKNTKVINEKYCGDNHVPVDTSDLSNKTCGGRKAVYSYVKAGTLCFDDVDFIGGVAVFDEATFTDCTFTESGTNMYALFVDNQYGGNVIDVTMTNCTVTASGYGCVKVADNKNEGGTIEVTNCTFNNTTLKEDINANGRVIVIIDGYYQVSSIDDFEQVAAVSTGVVKVKLTDDITIGTTESGAYSEAVRFQNATSLEIDGGNNQITLVGETQYINGNRWQTAGIYADNADVTIRNVTFQNNKTNGGVKKCGSRFPIYTMVEAKGEGTQGTVTFTDVTFNGGVVVFDNAIFTGCKFNENTTNNSSPSSSTEGQMYALFVDHQYDSTGEWTVTIDDCDFVVDNSYGTIKLADDAGATINFTVKDCEFDVDGTGKNYVVNAGSNCTVTFEGNNTYTGTVTTPQG